MIRMKVVALLSAFLVLAACAAPEPAEDAAQDDAKVVRKVKTAEAAMVTMGVPARAEAVLQAHARIEIMAEIGGVLEKKHAESGTYVEKGQVLYELDQSDLKSGLVRAELAKERVLMEMNNAKAQLREEDTSAIDMMKISLKEAELAISDARRSLEKTIIRSPIAGVITELSDAVVGQQISPGQRLVQVEQTEPLFAHAEVTEKDMLALESREELSIYLPALDATVSGKAVSITAAAAGQQSGFRFKVEVMPGASDLTLRPGMSAHVIIDESPAKETLAIPNAAVLLEDGASYVYRVTADGKAAKTPIEIGRMNQDASEVLGGLRLGDRIVVVGQSLLEDGDAVEVME